jgi:hypothetical protein
VFPEGRFGEFTRLMGGLHWNPQVRITAVTMRRDAVYYALHMPWENTWLAAPTRYNAIRRALKTAGVPIDHYSFEAVELLKDLIARWQGARSLRSAGAFAGGNNPVLARASNVPDIDVYAIDVSFSADPDAAARDVLNDLPTSFVLSDAEVDLLRASAGRTVRASPDFQRLRRDVGATVAPPPPAAPAPASR